MGRALLHYLAALQGARGTAHRLVHCLLGAEGMGDSFNILPHCMGQWAMGILEHTAALKRAMGSGYRSVLRGAALGSAPWDSFRILPQCR